MEGQGQNGKPCGLSTSSETLSREDPEILVLLWKFVLWEIGGRKSEGRCVCEDKGRYVNLGFLGG